MNNDMNNEFKILEDLLSHQKQTKVFFPVLSPEIEESKRRPFCEVKFIPELGLTVPQIPESNLGLKTLLPIQKHLKKVTFLDNGHFFRKIAPFRKKNIFFHPDMYIKT